MKHLNIPLSEETYERLREVKGDRTWREALREEFGIEADSTDATDATDA